MLAKCMEPRVKNSSAIRAMFEAGVEMAKIYGKENVYDFSLGNPNVPAPPEVNKALIEVIQNEDPIKLHGYMVNAGFEETRTAIAENLNKRFGAHLDMSNIVMTAGAGLALNLVLRSILDIDDEIVVTAPYFVDYTNYVSNYHGKLVLVDSVPEKNFAPDMDDLRAKITPRTKGMLINSPNNPTGAIYSEETIKEIAAILEEKQQEYGHVIYLIADEPYRELVYDGSDVPFVPHYYDNTLVCYSFSKGLSLAGERIGYVLIPDESDNSAEFKTAISIANRISGGINAPSVMQLALAKCLDAKVDIDFYAKNAKVLYDGLTEAGFQCVKPQGAFYMWVKSPMADESEFIADMKEKHILCTPGSAFAGPEYVRISYCVAYETIVNAMPGFKELGKKYFG